MKSSFLFPACAFLSPCVSFLYTVLGDLCQGRYKMLRDDFYSFYIGLYVFLLSSRYVSLFLFLSLPYSERIPLTSLLAKPDSGVLRRILEGYSSKELLLAGSHCRSVGRPVGMKSFKLRDFLH